MSMDWLGPVISGATLIVVAVIEALAARERKRAKEDREHTEERAKLRAKEARLNLEMLAATCALSLICAKKLDGQHVNGDVEAAMTQAKEAQKEYSDFLRGMGLWRVGNDDY